MRSETHIRRARPDDAPLLARLRYEFRAALGTPDETEAAFLARCIAWMAPRLAPDARWCAWLAGRADDAALGAIWLQIVEKIPNPVREAESHGYVTNFYVREAARGAGTGTGLLDAALTECAARGVDAVFLWPTPRSRALYARHGFTADGILVRPCAPRQAPDA